jgi:hypothetical protein
VVTVLAVLSGVLALACALLVIEVWSLPRRRHRVLVNMAHDEGTIEGLLWQRRGCWLVLKDARLMRGPGDPLPVDGEVLIDKGRVAFLQVL